MEQKKDLENSISIRYGVLKMIVAERHVQDFLHRGAVQDVGMSFLDESFLELFLE